MYIIHVKLPHIAIITGVVLAARSTDSLPRLAKEVVKRRVGCAHRITYDLQRSRELWERTSALVSQEA